MRWMRSSRVPLRLPRDGAAWQCERVSVKKVLVVVVVVVKRWKRGGGEMARRVMDGGAEVDVDAG